MKQIQSVLVALWLTLVATHVQAVIETYEFSSAALEQRYHDLSAELRCPKCQNQNIADSNAPISQDLRRLLYEQLEAGASDEEILAYMVSRYGEFVRYRPAFNPITAVLWLAPALLLGGAVLVLIMTLRKRRGGVDTSQLDAGEQSRLQAMLAEEDKR